MQSGHSSPFAGLVSTYQCNCRCIPGQRVDPLLTTSGSYYKNTWAFPSPAVQIATKKTLLWRSKALNGCECLSETMLCCWGHSCQMQTAAVAAVKDLKNRKGSKGSSVAVGPGHLGHARSIRNCQRTVRSTEIAHSISPGSWPKQGSPGHISCLLRNTCWAKRNQLLSSVHFGKKPNSCIIDLTEYSAKQKQKNQTKWQLTALQEAVVSREHQHTNGLLTENEPDRADLCELSLT